jgi:hypothetical protein
MTLRRLLSEVRRLAGELPRCPSCAAILPASAASAPPVPITEGYRLPEELEALLAMASEGEHRELAELLDRVLAAQGDAWRMVDSQEAPDPAPRCPRCGARLRRQEAVSFVEVTGAPPEDLVAAVGSDGALAAEYHSLVDRLRQRAA